MSGILCVFGPQVRVQHGAKRGLPCLVHPGSQAQHKIICKTEPDKGFTAEMIIHVNFMYSFFGVNGISLGKSNTK